MAERSDRIVNRLMTLLGPRFYFSPVEPKLGVMFAIRERAPKGERWPDGQRDRPFFSPRSQQWEAILNTSPSDEVALERLRLFMFEKIDTSQPPPAALPSNLRDIIAAEVAAAVAKTRAEIASGEARPELIEAKVAQNVRHAVKRAEPVPMIEEGEPSTDPIEMWRKRAKILGIREPGVSRSGKIDGRWMRFATVKWAEHEAKTAEIAAP